MSEGFTPGPWTVLPSVNGPQFCVLTENGMRIDICRTYGFPPSNEANARLMAAAPELLDIVRRFMRATDDNGHINEPAVRAAQKRASAVFAKIQGKSS